MYEETHRIPLLVAGPGVERGAATEAFANLVDLAPTLLEQAAAEPLAGADGRGADGRSLAPLLAGSTPPDWPDDVFAEFHGYETTLYSARMIRTPTGNMSTTRPPRTNCTTCAPTPASCTTWQPWSPTATSCAA